MNEWNNSISFFTDDGEEIAFEVVEQTTIQGQNYLLVAEAGDDSEERQAYIMKEVLDSAEPDMVTYQFVEEEQELLSISKIFDEMLEDTDIIKQD